MKKHVKLRSGSILNSRKTALAKTGTLQRGKSTISSKQCLLTTSNQTLKCHAKSGSTRLIGDRAEALVQEVFEKAGIPIEQTANSGAKHYDGDMVVPIKKCNTSLRIEVKKRNTQSFSINNDFIDLIKVKALKHGGIPSMIVVNKDNQKLIVFELEDFVSMLSIMEDKCFLMTLEK